MKKEYILLGLVLMLFQFSIAQNKTRADRFFEKGDFIKAALYYENELYSKKEKHALENISTAYYNSFEYRKAASHLRTLLNGAFIDEDKTIDNKYNFMYYQVLSALGDYETALEYLKTYKTNSNKTFIVSEAIETIEEFKLRDPDYVVKDVQVNTSASEFGAMKLGDSLVFISDRGDNGLFDKQYKWTHRSFLDIYSVKVNTKLDTIGKVTKLSESINTKLHDGNFCFSEDGNTLFISKSNVEETKTLFNLKKENTIHLYKLVKKDGIWTTPEKLDFCINEFSYQHPALSKDGTKLYFSSNQEGGFGAYDLYFVDVSTSNEVIGLPKNLGSTINTENREHFPYVDKDGNLFFSSNGHLGLGMLDLFVSEFVDGKFTTPINLGAPINSRFDDFNLNYYSNTSGFFASNRNRSNNDEILHFNQTGEIFIREYNTIFEVRDKDTDELLSGVDVSLLDKNNEVIYYNTIGEQGVFNKALLSGRYTLKANKDGYIKNQISLKLKESQDQIFTVYLNKVPPPPPPPPLPPPPPPPPPLSPIEEIIAEKKIDPNLKNTDPKRFEILTDTIGPPVVELNGKLYFKLKPIYFDFDMWDIRADSKLVLEDLAEKLERFPEVKLKINSHTDSRGSERYNRILSERRAESTRNYLALQLFISARRFSFEGFGESKPIVSCPMLQCTDEEHQLNRRSEFEIIGY